MSLPKSEECVSYVFPSLSLSVDVEEFFALDLRKEDFDSGRVSNPNGWIHWKYNKMCGVAKEGRNSRIRDEAKEGQDRDLTLL